MSFISSCNRSWLKISSDDPGRGTGFLDLGDQPDRSGRSNRCSKVAWCRLLPLHTAPRPQAGVFFAIAATSLRFETTISSSIVIRLI